ncbi:MAG: hypothetical protein M1831_003466 [Alyxoria varia]|nr:MAG: hypothetical protein M1831_003466 [Alyxoria varia]
MADPTNEEEDWELEEGIPKPYDPVVQKFFQGRDALIAEEDKRRSEGNFRELLSPMAAEACSIVNQIRFEEMQSVWNPAEANQNNESVQTAIFPGMKFHLAKDRIAQTKLWNIVRRMPKGCLHHCHLDAMVDQDWLFREALSTDGINISSQQSLHSTENRRSAPFSFRFTKKLSNPDTSLWSESYPPNTWVPLAATADSFPEGGTEGFIEWLKGRCSITPDDSIKHHDGVDDIWRKFIFCIMVTASLMYYEPIYRKYLTKFFQELVDDGVRYVDIRAAFHFEYRKLDSEEAEDDYFEPIRVLKEEIENFQSSEKGRSFWGARMIWTAIRSFDKRDIVKCMWDCVETKKAFPDVIAGFDLVGQEDPGPSLADLLPILLHFRKICAQNQVNIPFFFHAGETSTSGTPADQNLFDAIVLGSKRLGHAFSLYKHPLLMNMMRDRHICVECCPVSEEVLRLTSSITEHPLPALLANGVPVSLSNDDPAVLGQGDAGVSHDFWQALQGIENLGLEGLGSLAENSVRYAAFEDLDSKQWTADVKGGAYGTGIRAKRMKEWKHEWEKFCQWVVTEFGPDVDLDPES